MAAFDLQKIEKLKARKNVKKLIKALDDPDYLVNTAAAGALGEIGDPSAVWPLVSILRVSKWYTGIQVRRKAVAKALGEIGDPDAVEPLIEALLGIDVSDVKPTVAEALGKIGDPRAVWPLIAALATSDIDINKAVNTALRSTGVPTVEMLIAGMSVKNLDVRIGSMKVLGQIGAPRAIDSLISALKDKDLRVRIVSAEMLGNIGNARAVLPLIASLKDGNPHMREAAVKALGRIADPRGVKPLIAVLGDKEKSVHQAAADSLKAIGVSAKEPLIEALKEKDSRVRERAAGLLEKLSWKPTGGGISPWFYISNKEWSKCVALGAPAVEPLIDALKDNDWKVREGAAKALGEIGDSHAVVPLIKLLKDGNITAAKALGKIGKPAVEPLIAVLTHEDDFVRRYAAEALGEIGDGHAVDALLAVLKDEDNSVRGAAAKALGMIGELKAVTPLIEMLKNSESRPAAAEALGKIGDGRAVEPLLKELSSENLYERRTVAKALVGIYTQNKVDEEKKQRILSVRETIRRMHIDQTHGCMGEWHDDNSGIGVEFPL